MMRAFVARNFLSVACLAAFPLDTAAVDVDASLQFPHPPTGNRNNNANANANAEEARWLVNTATWGVLSNYYETMNDGQSKEHQEQQKQQKQQQLDSAAISFADADGRIFFYLMGHQTFDAVTLTLSEASLEPTSNFQKAACGEDALLDPEDPRCAKLSLQGKLTPCPSSNESKSDKENNNCQDIGLKALFARHPEMKDWPEDHDFTVHQLELNDLWMISNYGGGGSIPLEDYKGANPKHHPNENETIHSNYSEEKSGFATTTSSTEKSNFADDKVPDWNKKVERARWIVAHSLWSTVSTISVRLDGSPWGNIRSVVDGSSYPQSTGQPVFYLPTPDPTAVDVAQDPNIALTFSEAALSERLDANGKVCGGLDPNNPLCAQVTLTGKAVRVQDPKPAQQAFGVRHPLAPWLSHGGAHTGGAYYTILPETIRILDYYGGATEVSVEDYLAWKVPAGLRGRATPAATTTTNVE